MAVENLAAFNKSVNDFAQTLVPAEQLLFLKKIALDGLRLVVFETPTDTGRLRGNWLVSVDTPRDEPVQLKDKPGNNTFARGERQIAKVQPFGVVFITNNVEYAEFVEEGTPKKAPVKMLANAVAALRTQFP